MNIKNFVHVTAAADKLCTVLLKADRSYHSLNCHVLFSQESDLAALSLLYLESVFLFVSLK